MVIKVTTSGGRRCSQLLESFHNESGQSRQRTLATLGRLELGGDVDPLIQSLDRAQGREDCGPGASAAVQDLQFLECRLAGNAWALWQLWQSLSLEGLSLAWRGSKCEVDTLACLRTMVFNRLCDSGSKPGVLRWLQTVALPKGFGFEASVPEHHHRLRAMDVLDEKEDEQIRCIDGSPTLAAGCSCLHRPRFWYVAYPEFDRCRRCHLGFSQEPVGGDCDAVQKAVRQGWQALRDPDGSLELRDGQLIRHLHGEGASREFLTTGMCRALVDAGLLVPFAVEASDLLRVDRLDFVSAPFEWCDAQLEAAARLTLEISQRIHAEGHELKDASAWNVVFRGTQPIFCDQLSFQPIRTRQWWAFGQFLRHFLFPLQVSHTAGLKAALVFRMSRDGIGAEDTRQVLGLRRFFTKSWPLLISTRRGAIEPAKLADESCGTLHLNLYRFCDWALTSPATSAPTNSDWARYTTERAHYSDRAVQCKSEIVASWLAETRPRWLIDYGANTGEYTRMAAGQGIHVIAVEQDHACVTQIFRQAQGDPTVYPVCANLADLCGGAGWAGSEHSSLPQRLTDRGDMVLMLALIHHLAVSESIPFDKIVELAAGTTTSHAIVELVGDTDPLLGRLAAQRGRRTEEFSLARQRAAFAARFNILAEIALPETQRHLVLGQKRAGSG